MQRLSSLTRLLLFFILVLNSSTLHAAFDNKALSETAGERAGFTSINSDDAGTEREKYKEGELLVKFKPGTAEESKRSMHKKHGAEKLKEFPKLRLHHLKLKKGTRVEDAVKQFQAEPEVEYAEPNFIYSAQGEPNDPRFGELWALRNLGQSGGTAGADIKAAAAWDLSTGSSDVVVAIIDSGIDYTHPDLAANIWSNRGFDYVSNDADPFDDHGHGTHVAGTIGAVGNNNVGVAGVNWNVKLTACKFLDRTGRGSTDAAIKCLLFVKGLKDAGANIVATNNSWGSTSYSQALYDAINDQRDILFIGSSGNSGTSSDSVPHYPTAYPLPNVISVTATDHNDALASFSNYGIRAVHVAAPGTAILSTVPASNTWGISGGYAPLSGTSMATPHVTGLAALLKAQQPGRDWRAIRNLILSGAEPKATVRDKTATGRRISALGSMTCSDRPLLVPLAYPTRFPLPTGQAVTLSALSINCELPAGPVTVTSSDGEVIALKDDGVAPDLAAGDGIFAASWTPVESSGPRTIERLLLAAPGGSAELPPLSITRYLPEPNVGHDYRQAIEAGGGTPPYSWSLSYGSLPDGLFLNPATGELAGSPAATGKFSFEVQVADAAGRIGYRWYALQVAQDQLLERRSLIFEDPGFSLPLDLALDQTGNAYLTGVTESGAGKDFLTVKFDPLGRLLWGSSYDSGGNDWAEAVALGPDGNLYVTGGFPTLAEAAFVTVKYDSSGNQLWARTHDTGKNEYSTDVAVDAAGNVYVSGVQPVTGNYNAVLVKYDSAGNLQWVRNYDTGETERNYSVETDAHGNVYVTGSRSSFVNQVNLQQYLTLKYSPDGTLLWVRTHDDEHRARAVAVAADGSVYLGGEYQTLKYDPAGSLLWSRTVPVAGIDLRVADLALDSEGYLLAAGYYNNGSGNVYAVAKLDAAGNLIWTKGVPGDTRPYALISIAAGSSGFYVARPYGGTFLATRFEEVVAAPVADFASSTTSGSAPLLVNFSNLSSGAATSWLWDFGDLSSSSAQNPQHIYSTPGSYRVTLTASNKAGSDTRTRADYITVLACANAPVRIPGTSPVNFGDLPAAYLQAADSDIIQLQALNFNGDLHFGREIMVRLRGGYDCGFSEEKGRAGLLGRLRVSGGTVNLGNIRFR